MGRGAVDSRRQMERRGLPGLRTSVRSEWVSDTLAGLRLGGGEHAGLAAADDRIASRFEVPAAGAEVVRA